MPELYIITGSNGAGKSSVGAEYLPHRILEQGPIFDGDNLFVEKRNEYWKSDIKSHKECRNLVWAFVEETFDNRVAAALTNRTDFAYEGHFTNEATWDIPRRFLAASYSVQLLFLGLQDTALSELRVIDRSRIGGHYVDPLTAADNFYGNLAKLDQHFGLFHSVHIIDASESEHLVLAVLSLGTRSIAVPSDLLPNWFVSYLPLITQKIRDHEPKFL
jgi:predicted ABC-type ATPase